MTTNTQTRTNAHTDAGYETSRFALGVGITASALIGTWAVACLTSVVLQNGIGATLRGLLGAVVGS